ncbi:hypothetical protein BDZ91DRAFT_735986 [Kalaharituber pfeilii]|nr:hypothetical protein BDZ91DRAFT_735986 [Kalaharituber pfeilii]
MLKLLTSQIMYHHSNPSFRARPFLQYQKLAFPAGISYLFRLLECFMCAFESWISYIIIVSYLTHFLTCLNVVIELCCYI